MARKSVSTKPEGTAINFKKLQRGVKFEGVLLRHSVKPNQFNPSQSSYLWFFRGKDNKEFRMYGKSQLDRGLLKIKPGSYVWIEYLGKNPIDTAKGQVLGHTFKVEADEESPGVEQTPVEAAGEEIPY